MTLARLPDPKPELWINDYSKIMSSKDWYGFEHFGLAYGNFWSSWPCRVFPHRWMMLGCDNLGIGIRRCQRCGSQYNGYNSPPERGSL